MINLLEVIIGCMFSGKTELFIKKVNELKKEGKNVVVLKPIEDTRYSKNDVISHSGFKTKGISIEEVSEIYDYIDEEVEVLAIDEAQFFSWDLPEVANELANKGIHIIIAGLNLDFKGEPFGIMPELMALSDKLFHLQGTCSVCKKPATRSQRLYKGKPANPTQPIVMIGNEISYESRCRKHFEI